MIFTDLLEKELLTKAILNLYPEGKFGHSGTPESIEPLEDFDVTLVKAEFEKVKVEYESTQYQRDRQYPSIGDQLDMIFHAGLGGDEFQAAIQAVKDAYPKPTE